MVQPNVDQKVSVLVALATQCMDDSQRWFPIIANDDLAHHSLGMAGEVGEFCNLVKKLERGSLDPKDSKVRYDLAMELTDVFIYMLNIAAILRIDLEASYGVKRAHNERRFTDPNKSNYRSTK